MNNVDVLRTIIEGFVYIVRRESEFRGYLEEWKGFLSYFRYLPKHTSQSSYKRVLYAYFSLFLPLLK